MAECSCIRDGELECKLTIEEPDIEDEELEEDG